MRSRPSIIKCVIDMSLGLFKSLFIGHVFDKVSGNVYNILVV